MALADDFAMSMDGGTVQTDTSGNIPTSINNLWDVVHMILHL